MPSLVKVSCVQCPNMGMDYIAVADCRLCPFHRKDAGRSVECGYTFKRLDAEPSKDKEWNTKW